jgi:hypothetical protein
VVNAVILTQHAKRKQRGLIGTGEKRRRSASRDVNVIAAIAIRWINERSEADADDETRMKRRQFTYLFFLWNASNDLCCMTSYLTLE